MKHKSDFEALSRLDNENFDSVLRKAMKFTHIIDGGLGEKPLTAGQFL